MQQPPLDDIRARFAAAPWEAIAPTSLGVARKVPSMLSETERKLYFWAARDWAQGRGAIVDLGCFAGGSTACLAEGQRQAGHGAPIHGYDRFTATSGVKKRVLQPAGIPPFRGRDILPVAQALLSPWSDRVTLHPGEIEENGWHGGPIEILVLDACKSTEAIDRMSQTFYPALIAGGALVIQQDYFHWRQPWIAAQMERLADHFVPLAPCPDSTMIFFCRKPPDAAALVRAACTRMRDKDLIAGVQSARARLAGFGMTDRFDHMIAAIRANPGQRIAWRFERP
ncbi:hypothetical protein [Rhodovulum adriaticum]|uniref:Methyltransferase family protein n=1 Tax=Rhodovulum adriaticum TaxID=35804 RepID=A0A4R2NI51_RHOAD|nr:hypothetical protein [Rhodovulum adriaticum]MBK1635426.1 hypothetical protein [Rhodovulum adriaticum]TCP21133.1 hypothetical protein EV656_11354 [Rhodovulum adriaticum]